MKSKIFIILFTVLCVFITYNRIHYWQDKHFIWDKACYHLYLPATIIYNDLDSLSFNQYIIDKYQTTTDTYRFAIYPQPNGKKLIKYPAGISCMELPFFLMAHLYCSISPGYIADGYSLPYQLGSIFSNIIWVMIGLFYLRRFLKVYYSDRIVLFTLVCIALGTNLYHYTAFDQGMSHPYSFTLFAALLFYTDKWYTYYKKTDLWLLALVLGFITITRPVNIIILLIPLFWRVASITDIKNRFILLNSKCSLIISASVIFVLVVFIQLSYWEYITGHWLVYSYPGEGFNFMKPRIIDGLFSFRKGWFVYTPIAFISILGFRYLWVSDKKLAVTLLSFMVLMVYIVFSWRCWWYGGGFGARAMVESLAIIAVPLAALFNYIHNGKWLANKAVVTTIFILFISLNMFQSYQYALNCIHPDRMTKKYYFRIFCKLTTDENDKIYLMSDEEYWSEMDKAYTK